MYLGVGATLPVACCAVMPAAASAVTQFLSLPALCALKSGLLLLQCWRP